MQHDLAPDDDQGSAIPSSSSTRPCELSPCPGACFWPTRSCFAIGAGVFQQPVELRWSILTYFGRPSLSCSVYAYTVSTGSEEGYSCVNFVLERWHSRGGGGGQ